MRLIAADSEEWITIGSEAANRPEEIKRVQEKKRHRRSAPPTQIAYEAAIPGASGCDG